VAEIQRKVIKRGNRSTISRLFHSKDDKEAIAAWGLDLNRILHVFNVSSFSFVRQLLTVCFQTELAINIHVVVSDIHRAVVASQEGTHGTTQLVSVACALFIPESTLTIS